MVSVGDLVFYAVIGGSLWQPHVGYGDAKYFSS